MQAASSGRRRAAAIKQSELGNQHTATRHQTRKIAPRPGAAHTCARDIVLGSFSHRRVARLSLDGFRTVAHQQQQKAAAAASRLRAGSSLAAAGPSCRSWCRLLSFCAVPCARARGFRCGSGVVPLQRTRTRASSERAAARAPRARYRRSARSSSPLPLVKTLSRHSLIHHHRTANCLVDKSLRSSPAAAHNTGGSTQHSTLCTRLIFFSSGQNRAVSAASSAIKAQAAPQQGV